MVRKSNQIELEQELYLNMAVRFRQFPVTDTVKDRDFNERINSTLRMIVAIDREAQRLRDENKQFIRETP